MELKSEFKCPVCKRDLTVNIRDMVPGRKSSCPHCHTSISFSGADGRKVQRALDDLQDTLRKLSR